MKYQNIREEELKNKVGNDFFNPFDTTKIIGNIDFCVSLRVGTTKQSQQKLFETQSLLWAEAKTGNYNVVDMFVQLILTIGKARTFDKYLPPAFLGAFDFYKIAFVPYSSVSDIFYLNDFNWNVTPSNHETKEFKLIKERIENTLQKDKYQFDFETEEKLLQFFIKNNLAKTTQDAKIAIDKNNFVSIYLRWLEQVKPCIELDWVSVKNTVLDSDFYLADLFVDDKGTSSIDDDTPLSDSLMVVFKNGQYQIQNKFLDGSFKTGYNAFAIKDKNTYEQFWKKYKRPPLEKFQNFILERKDLLVPQDIRERRGAFFTPKKWVELSQQYIADVLGDDWQEEYYVWDCAAGTGNLLFGLTNPYNIYASTLDQSDVNVMHESIDNHTSLLLKNHVFQFDFLNDDFTKLPQSLQDIINDPEKRKKLVVYINPPYAEATSSKTATGTGENKSGLTTNFKINDYFKPKIGNATNEIFALFMANIYEKLDDVILGQFSTLKFVNGSNFEKFKDFFLAKYLVGFVVPADTFDNVKGSFPIGFTLWDTSQKQRMQTISCNVYNRNEDFQFNKCFYGNLPQSINKWIVRSQSDKIKSIGTLFYRGNDFQNQKFIYIDLGSTKAHDSELYVNANNLIISSIYLAMRHFTEATWLNDRDQFLYPNDGWQTDLEFQNNCLAFALFHSQNKISSNGGAINHWIPFTEQEVSAKEKFASNFMTQFIKGKIKQEPQNVDLFSSATNPVRVQNPNRVENNVENNVQNPNRVEEKVNERVALEFSETATAVFTAGRALWTYYHSQPVIARHDAISSYNPNASLYDIREHFQGRNDKGKMNNKSSDQTYMKLITQLRESLKILAKKIEPKVYEYGFLKD